jgi:hypothetical protein
MAIENGDRLFYAAGGPVAALLLGIVLVPLREATTASNLTFAFMALIILVAQAGGRNAAVATALSSALSLDFFLTRPYLRLAIEGKHDLIAFFGLAACGLVAAAAASRQDERAAALRASRAQRKLARLALEQLEKGVPREVGLSRVLDASRGVLPLAEAVVQDGPGNVLAATARALGRPTPSRRLDTAWEPPDAERGTLPTEGVRFSLVAGGRSVGWLDVWGNGRPTRPGAWQALSDVARLIALLAAAPNGGAGAGREAALPETPRRE